MGSGGPNVDDYLAELKQRGKHRPLFFKLHVAAFLLGILLVTVVVATDYGRYGAIALGACFIVSGVLAVLARRSIVHGKMGRSTAFYHASARDEDDAAHQVEARHVFNGVIVTLIGLLIFGVSLYRLLT